VHIYMKCERICASALCKDRTERMKRQDNKKKVSTNCVYVDACTLCGKGVYT
jgi:hypothetical protein